MPDKLYYGIWRYLLPLPARLWRAQLPHLGEPARQRLSFMTPEHHRLREYVVVEIARQGRPLSPGEIAAALSLPETRIVTLLDDLEKHMTFLFRNSQGEVAWAYPVTAACTPHRVTLDGGEHCYAA
jgi:hypothetical protein